jgi:asparagine synthase (glutamine-hydrolysing)
MLSADTLRRRGLFDPKAVAVLVADDQAGRVDAAYTILGLVCIERGQDIDGTDPR